ncbi:MAG: tRNA (guanosine(37)-N1)-methyltransferase TrmD [Dehalococcoidia bacterium]|nr:tRNA (guanosine(37)-N1)-methyltransferase TrmD [Dehalococcoidia bacterium]
MKVNILTLFPEFFSSPLNVSILNRAINEKIIHVDIHDLREWGIGKHRQVDDTSYGGGPGMVLMAEPLIRSIDEISKMQSEQAHVILMTPQGEQLNYETAKNIAKQKNIIIVCGKYEGIDERVVEKSIDQQISLADVVFSGGEIPALALIDSVSRLIPGVLGDAESLNEESFCDNLLEYPHYTKPASVHDMHVPEVLLSGNHKMINDWRHKQQILRTALKRKDLIEKKELTTEEKKWLVESNDET